MKPNYKYLSIIIFSLIYLVVTTVYSSVQNENINKIFQCANSSSTIKPQTNNPLIFNNPPKLNNISVKLEKESINENEIDKYSWAIYIPKINTIEKIFEGTDLNTLEKGVGHFANTTKDKGNICLAGHNIGINTSPFKYLFTLEKDDYLIYKYNDREYKYILSYKKEIDETDFSHIENTNDNNLTIITCIVGKKTKRLVVRFKRIN